MKKKYDVAILGATGAVGKQLLELLSKRKFPVGNLYALASERSAGDLVSDGRREFIIEDAAHFDFSKVQLALFSAGSRVSAIYAPKAIEAGCWVIDNTSCFRYETDVPLVIPEINPETLSLAKKRHIVANPNCCVMQMLVALKPIYDAVGITRINVATYQSVSGTGQSAIEELVSQTAALLNGQKIKPAVYPVQIAFNVMPQVDRFEDNGYTLEEMKIIWETKKIFNDEKILVNPTAVRVPVFYGHSEAIHLETRDKITAKQAKALLDKAPGVIVADEGDGQLKRYPTAVSHASGKDAVYVGRVREDLSHPTGLNLWVVSDNLRKGAALNAIQIAELLIEYSLL